MTQDYTQAGNASHLQHKYWLILNSIKLHKNHIKNHYKRIRM